MCKYYLPLIFFQEQTEGTLYLVPVEDEVIYPVDTYEVPVVYYL